MGGARPLGGPARARPRARRLEQHPGGHPRHLPPRHPVVDRFGAASAGRRRAGAGERGRRRTAHRPYRGPLGPAPRGNPPHLRHAAAPPQRWRPARRTAGPGTGDGLDLRRAGRRRADRIRRHVRGRAVRGPAAAGAGARGGGVARRRSVGSAAVRQGFRGAAGRDADPRDRMGRGGVPGPGLGGGRPAFSGGESNILWVPPGWSGLTLLVRGAAGPGTPELRTLRLEFADD